MKILYGVQATGNGHISRSRIMAQYLSQYDADVTYLFSGRDKNKLFAMEAFGHYEHRRGLTFAIENGRVNHLKTVLRNNFFRFMQDVNNLDLSEYDLVITDFEPITAWAAKRQNKPSIGIGHQYAFGSNTPIEGRYSIGNSVMKIFAPVKHSAGLHWYPFDNRIFPPIIDLQLQRKSNDNSYLVYLPFENQALVTTILNKLSDFRFIQYSPDICDGESDNVSLRKTSLAGFKQDLCKSQGVICNAGFELISECLHLGVPILAKPLAGQIEQRSNALALSKLGYADILHRLDYQGLLQWLQKDKPIEPHTLPNVANALAKWVLSGDWKNCQLLSEKLWEEGNVYQQFG